MALAHVHVFRELSHERAAQLARAVTAALVAALRVPANDPTVWIDAHSTATSVVAGRHSVGLVHVRVTMFAGRTDEMKCDLHRLICAELVAIGVAARDVLVVVDELPVAAWSIAGQVEDE